jgi:hypothetical protein
MPLRLPAFRERENKVSFPDFMRAITDLIAVRRALLLCLSMTLALGCQPPHAGNADPGAPTSGTTPVAETRTTLPAPRDLSQDEAAGGHTLRKHVGCTDAQLRERLRHEPEISAASTWSDRETAERALGLALAQNQDKIQRWLARDRHPNLVLDYDGDQPLGRSLRRGAGQPQPCSHATIVLKWSPPGSYYVLTSYPECRS